MGREHDEGPAREASLAEARVTRGRPVDTPAVPAETLARLRDGSSVAIARAGDADQVTLVDAAGATLLEYDTRSGTVRLCSPRGDLLLAAPRGAVRVESARGFSVETQGPCVLESRARGDATARASLRLERGALTAAAAKIEHTAREIALGAEEVRTVARSVATTAESMKLLAGVLETRATRLFSRATHAYHEVDELLQTRAARVRTLASEALHLFGRRAFVGADEEVKVDAEQIRLG